MPLSSRGHDGRPRWRPGRCGRGSAGRARAGLGGPAPHPDAGIPALSAPDRVRLQIVVSAVEAAPSMAELADRLLAEGVESLAADSVVIYLAEPDGALRMASCAGLPAQVASDWQPIPSAGPTRLGEAPRIGRPPWVRARHPRQH